MHTDVEKILISELEIQGITARLGAQISQDYAGKELLLITILKGSVVFAADLMRKISVPTALDFMRVSSYGNSSASSGIIQIIHDLTVDIAGKHVLIVEDIIDSGNTLYKLRRLLKERNPASVKICTMLDKPDRRVSPVAVEYVGEEIPDEFVVGYGLDYDEKYRNLPYIGVLKRSVYE